MSAAIRDYQKHDQQKVINRRLVSKTLGLGYWSAVDATKRQQQQQTVASKGGKQ